jgi:hypothetical protein
LFHLAAIKQYLSIIVLSCRYKTISVIAEGANEYIRKISGTLILTLILIQNYGNHLDISNMRPFSSFLTCLLHWAMRQEVPSTTSSSSKTGSGTELNLYLGKKGCVNNTENCFDYNI